MLSCCRRAHSSVSEYNRRKRPTSENTEAASRQEEPQREPAKENPTEILPPPVIEGEMPTYFHMGGQAKYCLLEGYKNGKWGLMTTTKTENELYLSSFGEGYPFQPNAYGGMEVLQEMGPYHASLCWMTDQAFLSDLGVRGAAFGGLMSSVLKMGAITAEELQVTGKLKCGFDCNPIKVEVEVPLYKQPFFKGYIVMIPAEHFLLGYRTVFDIEVKEFYMHALCLGFDNKSTELCLKLENFELLRGSVFQRLGEKWAVALKSDIYGSNVGLSNFHVGCQYEWDPDTLIKAKITGEARLGLIYKRKLSEGIDVLLNCCFDGLDPLNGKIKLGAAWYFNV
ncbi:hypothetical protein KR054_012457 [Drosophila jambulina]|nr:hypothetical protein KR054_012457 [Drosophila jambulina]